MHELSVAEAVIAELEELVRREGARRVARVVLRVGALSGVEPDALEFAFPVAAEGTCAEGAELVLESEPVRVRCGACGAETAADPLWMACGACGADAVEIISGADLTLRSAELIAGE